MAKMQTPLPIGTCSVLWTLAILGGIVILSACAHQTLPNQVGSLTAGPTGSVPQAIATATSLPIAENAIEYSTSTPLPTPSPTVGPAPSPTAGVSTPSVISPDVLLGKILFAATRVAGLALDDEFIYWTEPGRIVRQRLVSPENSKPEIVVETIYTNGRLDFLDSQRTGDWLFFVDCEGRGIPFNWTLFAINVKTREKKAILQSQGTGLIYAYAVDGGRVGVTLLDHSTTRKCQDESVLAVIMISTLQHQELDRTCFDSPFNWMGVAISGDTVFASRFYDSTREFEIVRYDLKSGSGQPLNQSTYAPVSYVDGGSLAVSPSWLAWESSENSAFLLNWHTGNSRQVSPPDVGILKFPQISGHWLYWRVNEQPVVYDIEQNTLHYLVKLETNQSLDDFVMYGNRAAWVVDLQADQAVSDSVIEWADLPAETGAPGLP